MRRHVIGDAEIALDDLGTGPPVLLLHGFPSTRRLWGRVAPALADAGFRVLAPDLAGYGDSAAAPGARVDMASQARWMEKLLDALGLAQVAVVAHDVGTAAAQLLATGSPGRVRALALADGVYLGEWAMEAVHPIQRWEERDAARLHPVLLRRLGRSEGMREMLAAYEGDEGGRRLVRAARDLEPAQTEGLAGALRALAMPRCVLWGERDAYLPLDGVGRPLAALLGTEPVVLPGGHFTPLDSPTEMAGALLAFLRALPPQG
ncbi:MAG TPA: alpha/beta fold hydrolase [Anaeromyxobacteraceae bacterium]|nr:alpha/beta fold hydrolase [Anaeromyxobacteraceae bacterium]